MVKVPTRALVTIEGIHLLNCNNILLMILIEN